MGKCLFCGEKLYFGKKDGFHYKCGIIVKAIEQFGPIRTLVLIQKSIYVI